MNRNWLSASRYNHNGPRKSTYVMANRSKTLPNTYLELAEYQGFFHCKEFFAFCN